MTHKTITRHNVELPTLEEVASDYIRRVLQECGGNKSHAAQVLGMDRRTLYRRLARMAQAEVGKRLTGCDARGEELRSR